MTRNLKLLGWVFGALLAVGLHANIAFATPIDVSAKVTIQKSGFVLNRATNTFDTTLIIRNITIGDVLAVPFQVVVSGLPIGVTLQNATGTTATGLRYLNVSLPGNALIPGTQVTNVVLKFTNPNRVALAPTISAFSEVPVANLPPDPGEAGKATLEGIDSDHDGVRDDIQRYIAFTYPVSARMRASLTSFAVGMQSAVLSAGSTDNALLANGKLNKAQDCLWYLQGSASIPVWQELRAQYLNTVDRSRAYTASDRLLNGMVFDLTPTEQLKSQCEFDPDALPN